MTPSPIRWKSLVDFMRAASTYPDRPSAVHVVETHISWVFLTDRHAYKLKKPVRFEFVDFSTAELRRRACLEEVRLNGRLAPDVYLAVLPITQDANGALELHGSGEEVDWVVQMRRLPKDAAVDVLLSEGRLRPEQAQAIARLFAGFYAGLPAKPTRPEEYRGALERHIRANGAALLEELYSERSRVRRLLSAQLRYVNVHAEMLDARVAAGRIVEGHGDLRPEHIYLAPDPKVIDCIEFSEELRTVDVADELSFLDVECERLGDATLGEAVLAEYQRAAGDEIAKSLLDFYRGYRALVRAKVAVLREQQLSGQSARRPSKLVEEYFGLAEHYAAQLGPPMLLVVGGLMGSGKSTLAGILADACGIELLSTDRIRRSLFGASETPAGYGEGRYQADVRQRVYDELIRRAGDVLKEGQSVVLDGAFLTTGLREQAYDAADRHGAASLFVYCTCPRRTAYERIQKRIATGDSESEARTELYDLQARDLAPPGADDPAVTVDTTQPMGDQPRAVFNELRRLLFDSR